MVRGGFPDPAALPARDAWFDGYLTTVTLRDLGQVADVRRPQDLLRLMRYAATFAHSPLQRACAWRPLRVSVSHWRDRRLGRLTAG